MPWSWARVSTGTSPKLQNCMAATRRPRKPSSIRTIVEARGGRIEDVKFEPNGRWARVYFYWEDPHTKHAIVLDLQAQQVLDVISGDEMDSLIG